MEEKQHQEQDDSLPVEKHHLINLMRKLLDENHEDSALTLCELSTEEACCKFLHEHGVTLIVEKSLLDDSCSDRTRELCCVILVNVIAQCEEFKASRALFRAAGNLIFSCMDPQTLFAVFRFMYSLITSTKYPTDQMDLDSYWFIDFDQQLVERSLVLLESSLDPQLFEQIVLVLNSLCLKSHQCSAISGYSFFFFFSHFYIINKS